MKIVRIVTRLNIGGPAIHVALLSTRLNAQQFSTCLVVGEPGSSEGDLRSLVQDHEARVVHLKMLRRPLHAWRDAMALGQLLRVIWQERPHIIHTHMAKAGALGRVAGLLYNRWGPGRRAGARAVLIHTFHGHVLDGYFSPWLSRVFVRIERWLAGRTDCLIAVSQTVRNELVAKGIGRQDQWRVIPLGLDLSAFAQVPLSGGQSPVRVGMVGRLVSIKNPALFLQALSRLVQQRRGEAVHGLVVGDGPLRQALEQEAKHLGLGGIVRFAGWQQDLPSLYAELEVACLTSWNEGTPVALIEAMAAGRAVVATDVGGVPDLLDGEGQPHVPVASGTFRITERGILVQPGDPQGLTDALQVLASDPALRHRLGRAARTHVMQQFDPKRLLSDIAMLYEELQGGRECMR